MRLRFLYKIHHVRENSSKNIFKIVSPTSLDLIFRKDLATFKRITNYSKRQIIY